MRSSSKLLSLLATLLLSARGVTAVYFTVPQAGSVWTGAVGQVITWHFQAGDPGVADLILESADKKNTVIVAKNLALSSEGTTFPAGIQLGSSSGTYFLLLVDALNTSYVYSSVGPMQIRSFTATASSGGASTSLNIVPIPNPKTSATEGSPVTTTQPAVSTSIPSTSKSTSTTTSTTSTPPTTSSTSTTTPSSSSSSSSVAPLTVTSTAGQVTLTTSSSGDFVVTTFVTATPSSATLISGKASSSSTVKASAAWRGREARWTAEVLFAVGVSWVVL